MDLRSHHALPIVEGARPKCSNRRYELLMRGSRAAPATSKTAAVGERIAAERVAATCGSRARHPPDNYSRELSRRAARASVSSRPGSPVVRVTGEQKAKMAGEEWRTAESGGADEDREREDEARRARAQAEVERAAAEREGDRGKGGDDAEAGVLPADTDEERRGVMPPPASGS